MNLLSNIPGYQEALDQERQNRDLAFLRESLPIAGIPVRHMNARHWILLDGFGNRFLTGEPPTPEDVSVFLWVVSPRYSTRAEERAAFIADTLLGKNLVELCLGIYAYLERTFWDAAGKAEDGRKHYAAPVASIVDLMGSQYGWSDEATLECPLGRIFQYIRKIERRLEPKCIQFNRSDRALARGLQQQMAASSAAAPNN